MKQQSDNKEYEEYRKGKLDIAAVDCGLSE